MLAHSLILSLSVMRGTLRRGGGAGNWPVGSTCLVVAAEEEGGFALPVAVTIDQGRAR